MGDVLERKGPLSDDQWTPDLLTTAPSTGNMEDEAVDTTETPLKGRQGDTDNTQTDLNDVQQGIPGNQVLDGVDAPLNGQQDDIAHGEAIDQAESSAIVDANAKDDNIAPTNPLITQGAIDVQEEQMASLTATPIEKPIEAYQGEGSEWTAASQFEQLMPDASSSSPQETQDEIDSSKIADESNTSYPVVDNDKENEVNHLAPELAGDTNVDPLVPVDDANVLDNNLNNPLYENAAPKVGDADENGQIPTQVSVAGSYSSGNLPQHPVGQIENDKSPEEQPTADQNGNEQQGALNATDATGRQVPDEVSAASYSSEKEAQDQEDATPPEREPVDDQGVDGEPNDALNAVEDKAQQVLDEIMGNEPVASTEPAADTSTPLPSPDIITDAPEIAQKNEWNDPLPVDPWNPDTYQADESQPAEDPFAAELVDEWKPVENNVMPEETTAPPKALRGSDQGHVNTLFKGDASNPDSPATTYVAAFVIFFCVVFCLHLTRPAVMRAIRNYRNRPTDSSIRRGTEKTAPKQKKGKYSLLSDNSHFGTSDSSDSDRDEWGEVDSDADPVDAQDQWDEWEQDKQAQSSVYSHLNPFAAHVTSPTASDDAKKEQGGSSSSTESFEVVPNDQMEASRQERKPDDLFSQFGMVPTFKKGVQASPPTSGSGRTNESSAEQRASALFAAEVDASGGDAWGQDDDDWVERIG